MSDKIPPHNSNSQFKSIIKVSLIFFIFVSVLAVSYESFKEEVNPFLDEYLPGSVEMLEMGAMSHRQTMQRIDNVEVKK